MKILLVGNYEPGGQKSMQRFAAMLDSGFRAAGHETRVIRPPVVAGSLPARGLAGKWLGYVDQFIVFPKLLKRAVDWADVVHICDHSNAFYAKYVRRRPHIVTCHDMLAIRSALGEIVAHRTAWTGRRLQSMILQGLRAIGTTGHISCVSEATRQDLLRITEVPRKSVSRIYNALNFPFSPQDQPQARACIEKLGIRRDQRFILHVGGNSWYKNRLGTLKIFSALKSHPEAKDVILVMAGQLFSANMRAYLRTAPGSESVVELVDPANEELKALYSAADVMLFPSLQEGFGWPIIEAQACGCPVVTSNRPPMTEVGGEAAVYIDPEKIEAAAATIAGTLQGRKSPCEKSLKNAERFSTSRMIESYLALQEIIVCSKN
jgi:glycosyltransferase involved in cell wall biosynthesis